jgi:hypothetical protein
MDTNTSYKSHHFVERFGELIKEEPLSSISDDLTLPETVVLESKSPFFGYYDDAPLSNKQPYLYFLLDECHSLNKIFRAVLSIRKTLTHPLFADLGSVNINNQRLPVIRIKGIEKYCRIRHLQKSFIEEGIKFKKSFKKISEEMAVIELQKLLRLKAVGQGLYFDNDEPSKGYFVIPEYLEWEQFKSLTTEAKYETGILYFDAAQAVIFEHNKVIDLVRIYRKDLALEKLSAVRDRYLKVLGQS